MHEVVASCDYYYPMAGVSFMLDYKRIVRIETSSNEAITPSDIRVGDSISKQEKTFGNRLKETTGTDLFFTHPYCVTGHFTPPDRVDRNYATQG